MSWITDLADNEVFVFGSNLEGFHGAGSAGFAMRGDARNNWRDDHGFLDIVRGRSSDKRGRWAVFGVGRGYQVGKTGRSYAIPTVERPGLQGSVTPETFSRDLLGLVMFAWMHPELKFLVVPLGATRKEGGYSWLGLDVVEHAWEVIRDSIGIPANIVRV